MWRAEASVNLSPVKEWMPLARSESKPANVSAYAWGSPCRGAIHRAALLRSAGGIVRPSKKAALTASTVWERLVLWISMIPLLLGGASAAYPTKRGSGGAADEQLLGAHSPETTETIRGVEHVV